MTFSKQQRRLELASRGLKQCPKCLEPKPLSEFGKCTINNDGLTCHCKKHIAEISKKHYVQNNEKKKTYQKENIVKKKEYDKEHYEENKAKRLKKVKQYQNNNKEKIAKTKKVHYELNKEEILEKAKKYREKPENKIRTNKRMHLKYHTDINFKIRQNISNRILKALKENWKSGSTLALLGCTIKELKQHLQSQFTEGMSWDNHGLGNNNKKEWHIDHIKPCASFDLSKESEQLKCFNFKNLQPLWAVDNIKKGSKYGFSF